MLLERIEVSGQALLGPDLLECCGLVRLRGLLLDLRAQRLQGRDVVR